MAEVLFTPEHLAELKTIYSDLSFEAKTIGTGIGGAAQLNPFELLNETTTQTLTNIRASCRAQLAKHQDQDEWTASTATAAKIESLKRWERFVHLLLGHKSFKAEQAALEAKKKTLTANLAKLKEENKTPAERMKELEEELAKLG